MYGSIFPENQKNIFSERVQFFIMQQMDTGADFEEKVVPENLEKLRFFCFSENDFVCFER